jgi:hypothetical protein
MSIQKDYPAALEDLERILLVDSETAYASTHPEQIKWILSPAKKKPGLHQLTKQRLKKKVLNNELLFFIVFVLWFSSRPLYFTRVFI